MLLLKTISSTLPLFLPFMLAVSSHMSYDLLKIVCSFLCPHRAVANYFQTLFHKEGVRAKRGLAMETLLAGKTRKEASRLFFETLVS